MGYWSERYGDLELISAKTDGRCHLCHEPVHLAFYGATGLFGDETCNVDHLLPQSHGGDDDHDNLLIAHGVCNSARGDSDAELARLALAGTFDAPLSAEARTALAILVGGTAGTFCGHAFARPSGAGAREFNWLAAIGGGLLAYAVTR